LLEFKTFPYRISIRGIKIKNTTQMILDFEYNGKSKKLIVSEINEKGNIEFNHYDWKNPKKFTPCSATDPDRSKRFTTWDKKPVKLVPVQRPNRFAIYEYIDALPEADRERLFKIQYPNIWYIDIETEILPSGFVEPTDANSRVLTIAIVNKDNVLVLGLKDLSKAEIEKIKDDMEIHFKPFGLSINFKYMSFHNRENPEKEMMKYFFERMIPKMEVVTGWNVLDYDWTFLVNRCRRIGLKPEIASPTGRLEKIFGTPYEVPAHRLIVDYLEIWKKAFNTFVKVRESNSLDWVSNHLFKLKKVHYDGGLQDLYDNDFVKYVFYNAVDTMLVRMIHEKTKLLDIIFSVANLSKIRLCDFAYKNLNATLVSTEGFLREKFRTEKDIIFCQDKDDEEFDSIAGGYVKTPEKGLQEWVAIFDFASLYPTTQIQNNIAPETFKGFRVVGNPEYADFYGTLNKIEEDDIICVNGAVFSKAESVTVNFLKDVYKQRKFYKNLMNVEDNKAKNLKMELDALEEELRQLEGR
jgi:DNA polymerase elongation subunit (family B)